MKELINISDFSWGIAPDETLQSNNSFANLKGFDIWSDPWYLSAMVDFRYTALFNIWTNTVKWMWYYSKYGRIFLSTSWGKFYNTTDPLSGFSELVYTDTWNVDWVYFCEYKWRLFYCKTNNIWYFTGVAGTTWLLTTLWGSFVNNQAPHIMVLMNDKMYISDWNVIAELDWWVWAPSSWVFNNTKATIPEWDKITAMINYNGMMYIGTSWGKIYSWWGEVGGATSVYSLEWSSSIEGFGVIENMLVVFFFWEYTRRQYLYYYNGSSFSPLIALWKTWIYNDYFGFNWSNIYSYNGWLLFPVVTFKLWVGSWIELCLLKKDPWKWFALIKFPTCTTTWKLDSLLVTYPFVITAFDGKTAVPNPAGTLVVWEKEAVTTIFDVLDGKMFDTFIKAIRIEWPVSGDVSVSYSVNNGSFSSPVVVSTNSYHLINIRARDFQIKLTLPSFNLIISSIKVYA